MRGQAVHIWLVCFNTRLAGCYKPALPEAYRRAGAARRGSVNRAEKRHVRRQQRRNAVTIPARPMPAITRTEIMAWLIRRSTGPPRSSFPMSRRSIRSIRTACRRITYGRYGTPTASALEEAVTALEGGGRAVVLSSGLAAITATLMQHLGAGDHLLMVDTVYEPDPRASATEVLTKFGVEITYYDPHDRRRHRRTDAAQHAGRLRGKPGLADLRDAGHPGHRRRRQGGRRLR